MLKVNHLSISYGNVNPPFRAVDEVSLDLRRGQTLGIIGESGCGKSTIALSVMGLLKQASINGGIRFQDIDLTTLKPKQWTAIRWRKIAMVFQNSIEVLNPVLTIGEQIGEPVRTHFKMSPPAVKKRVGDLLEQVGLSSEWMFRYPHQLSGGMRQRVLLAMAVSCDPELLIIDEPTTALDPESAEEILTLIETLHDRLKFSMILISHQLSAVRRMTDHVAVLYAGRILEEGFADDVLRDPKHCYTRGLLNASPDFYTYKDLWGIEGAPPSGEPFQGCVFYSRCCQREERCRTLRPQLRNVTKTRKVACHKGGIETFLIARNVWKTYGLNGKRVSALKGVDIEIKSGEVTALVGRSGSGKSTLAHILVNAVFKDEGRVVFKNQEISGHEVTSRMEGVQIVFQDPFSSISGRMKTIDVVCEPLDIMKWETKEARIQRALAAMAVVRLPVSVDFLNRSAYTLSGGQRQRLALARALAVRPKLLIADEITSMLDPSTQANIIRELKSIQNKYGFAMLFISHNLFLVRKIAERIYVMSDGEIVESGTAADILESPTHPVTRAVVSAAMPLPSVTYDSYQRMTG